MVNLLTSYVCDNLYLIRMKIFRFVATYSIISIVNNAWKLTVNARDGSVADAMREVGAELWDWSRNVLGDLEKRIKHAKRCLEECRN